MRTSPTFGFSVPTRRLNALQLDLKGEFLDVKNASGLLDLALIDLKSRFEVSLALMRFMEVALVSQVWSDLKKLQSPYCCTQLNRLSWG
jgi:hypothetical protein